MVSVTADRDIALRLRLPCPECGEVFSTTAYGAGVDVAFSCLQCGHGWVEPVAIDGSFIQRAAEFCASVEAATAAENAAVVLPDLLRPPAQPLSGRDN